MNIQEHTNHKILSRLYLHLLAGFYIQDHGGNDKCKYKNDLSRRKRREKMVKMEPEEFWKFHIPMKV